MFVGMGANSPSGYNITDSLRLRQSASAHLSRTPSSAGNRKTWTWSGWVKRGKLGSGVLWSARSGNTQTMIYFDGSDKLRMYSENSGGTTIGRFITSASYRDPSAWYHIVVVLDASNATASDRVILYVNGVRQTISITTAISNADHAINSTISHTIGREATQSTYFDGYISENHFVDGQALTASDFGEYNTDGVWSPKEYTGTYGTNGFYLNFSDGTSTTTLGYDYSGNSNNWTTNNISLTAGSTYDLMSDVPSLADEDTGNFATWNPLDRTSATYSEANLKVVSTSASSPYNMTSTISMPSGKWYAEIEVIKGTGNPSFGIGYNNPDGRAVYRTNATYSTSSGTTSGTPSTFTTGDTIGIAYDADAGSLSFYKNGVAQTGGITGIDTTQDWRFVVRADSASGDGGYLNCGQRPFAYTPPAGYKKLNTYNLPDSSITDGSQYMNTVLYTGDGTTSNAITGVGFQPDFTWLKGRSVAYNHTAWDAVRGAGKRLQPNTTNAEITTTDRLNSFDADGFTLGDGAEVNQASATYVAWNWKANGSGVSNTDGTITSTVSANTTSGFSVVTYTATGNGSDTVGHGLGVAPKVVILKSRSTTGDWIYYTTQIDGSLDYLYLNQTTAKADSGWTAPSSTVFPPSNTTNGTTMVAYCFADVEGFSKFGSYTGNGSTDGTFIYTGFRPAFVMVKRTDTTQYWGMYDSARDTYNQVYKAVFANTSGAEDATTNDEHDFLSNGFKMRNTGGSMNASGGTYIFMAFAENPFKNSLAR